MPPKVGFKMMHLIYTENDPSKDHLFNIKRVMHEQFPTGFTILFGVGCWNGKEENSVCIQVMNATDAAIRRAVNEIRELNYQESVMVVKQNSDVTFH